ncbi:uncharacterized protein TNIN_34971 [Trichonephila inaurata madagascariensis]|uniref:Ig-like domain-containing protein n=1 Tax=Trichonephila inaurata madagascariensis TaxID=2747483 RepID=A0A8X7CT91_9ARAC|nr:uncharacterized protein TNIN_34971 [Trichonephila inaurata madagascariensis]
MEAYLGYDSPSVLLNTGPAKIIDFPEKESVIKGRSLNLHCKAQGFPSPVITWYIGNLMASQIKEKDHRISIYSADGGVEFPLDIQRHDNPTGYFHLSSRKNLIDSGMTKNYDENPFF